MATQLTGCGMEGVRRFLSVMTNVIKDVKQNNGKPRLIEIIYITLPALFHAPIICTPSVT
ncbi:MAG: hypothetical protein ACLQBQ_00625 [Smithella sp.]